MQPPVRLSDLKPGDAVYADAGFTCLDAGRHVVRGDKHGLFILCDDGHHYLQGQLNDDDGTLSGISSEPFPAELVAERRQSE